MDTDNIKSFLQLKVIWKDEDMIEIEVCASNIDFTGKTEVYESPNSLYAFALKLVDYPKGDLKLFYEMGKKDGYSYFSMHFYPIDNIGKVGVEVNIESNVNTVYRSEEKNKIKLELIVEPSAIDNFQRELYRLANIKEGFAILYGRDNRI